MHLLEEMNESRQGQGKYKIRQKYFIVLANNVTLKKLRERVKKPKR